MNELQSLLNNTPDVSLFCTALRDKLELSKLTDSITSQINEAIDAMDPKVSHFFITIFTMVYTLYGGKRNMYIYMPNFAIVYMGPYIPNIYGLQNYIYFCNYIKISFYIPELHLSIARATHGRII